eukprot:PhM_4_TR18442/c5_g1_i4/m.72917
MTLITESSPSSSTSLTSSPPAEKSTRPRHHRQHHSREFARSDGSLIPLVHPPAPGGMCMSTSNVPVARPTSSLASTPPRPRRLGYDEDGKKLCANVTGFEFKLTTETPRVVHNAGRAYEVMKKDDFRHIRDICRSMDGWTEKFKDHDITVWTHPPDPSTGTKLNMLRARVDFGNVAPEQLYNCLHDPIYREVWDHNMAASYNVCMLDAHNDIGYYGAKLPTPLANRDFCNMRSWIELGPKQGFIIRNHSVPHPQCPEQKGYVRGRSICAGYYMFPREGGGTRMYWLAQSDPGGFLPHWAVNIATSKTCPGVMRKLGETVRAYPQWLQKNRPGFVAPWRTPAEPWSDEEDEDDVGVATSSFGGRPPMLGEHATEAEGVVAGEGTPAGPQTPKGVDPEIVKELRSEVERLRRKLMFVAHEASGSSLAPMRINPEEPECVMQARGIVQEVFDFVDRSYLGERRVPTMREYCARVYTALGTVL